MFIYVYIYLSLYMSRMQHKVNFKQSLIGLNSKFSFSKTGCHNKVEELCLLYYLPIAGGRIIKFIPFQRVLALCKMQIVSSSIWIHVAIFISYDSIHYTVNECFHVYINIYVCVYI